MDNKKEIHLIPLQSNTEQIVNEFLQFYYGCINEKNFYSTETKSIASLYKKYTEIKFNGHVYNIDNLSIFLKFMNDINAQITIKSVDILMSGNHRVNILVNGTLNNLGNLINFSDYIHFGTCKDNDIGYWIQSSIFRTHEIGKINYPIISDYDNERLVNQFIEFYYSCINQKNFNTSSSSSKSLISLYKQYSEIKFNGNYFKGEKLSELFQYLISINAKIEIQTVDILNSGKHRINILVRGVIKALDDFTDFSEYIHFGICKDNDIGYLIQSSIFRTFN